jgi:hypothetical protein
VAIIAIVGIIIGLMACNNDNETIHVHKWEGVVTTQPTIISHGDETLTCSCGETNGTHIISPLAFVNTEFAEIMKNLEDTTTETPYTFELNISENDFVNLRTILLVDGSNKKDKDKYIILNLSYSTITAIPDYAFFFYDATTDIELYCPILTGIIIPDKVKSIGEWAFCSTGLTDVTIPDSVTSIGGKAFGFCFSLTSVTIGTGVTSIGDTAFGWCFDLTSVTFKSVIPEDKFGGTFNDTFYKPFAYGDLCDKYLAENGGIGTYTRENNTSEIWVKQ